MVVRPVKILGECGKIGDFIFQHPVLRQVQHGKQQIVSIDPLSGLKVDIRVLFNVADKKLYVRMSGEYGVIICGAFLQRGAEDLQIARVIRQVIGEKLHIADPVVAAAFQHGLQQRFGQLGRQIIIPGFEALGKGSLIPQRGFQLILKRAVGVGPRRRQSRTVCIAVFIIVDLLWEEDRPRQTEQQPAEDQPHKGKIDPFLPHAASLPIRHGR